MSREEIFNSINKEREYQDNKWGGPTIDDKYNSFNDWVAYISKYSTRWFPGGFPPYDASVTEAFKQSMIKVAALAVAAIEQVDRQHVK